MAFASKTLAASALLALLSLGACATQGVYGGPVAQPYPGAPVVLADGEPVPPPAARLEARDGLLSSPPNNARPGECYAKVVVPGQPIGPPPPQPRAVWVQTPPGPGQVSPTWCIYYEQGAAPAPVAMTPERFGWIRVICDKDATVEEITYVQRRLHDWGVYEGAYDGHFNDATAQGVTRFQEERHINHGGYLSFKTVEALNGAPPPPPPVIERRTYAPTTYASPIYRQAAYPPTYAGPCGQPACQAPAPPPVIYQQQIIRQPVIQPVIQQEIIRQPVIQQEIIRQPVYVQQPIIQPQVIQQPVYVRQPIYQPQVIPQPIYVQQPIVQPQITQQPIMAGCGQPACMPQPQPCGGPVCGAPGGYGGYGQGGYGQGGYGQGGPAPYPALLNWPGKTNY